MDKLLRFTDVCDVLNISKGTAAALLTNHLIAPETGYSENAVRALLQQRGPRPDIGKEAVPPDAELPEVMVHQPTGWEVHPALGLVYNVRHGQAPDRLGFVLKTTGRVVAQRRRPDGSAQRYLLARVVWEAVNGQEIPIDRGGGRWQITYRNGDMTDLRYANLELRPRRLKASDTGADE